MYARFRLAWLAAITAQALIGCRADAEEIQEYVRSHYTKFEYQVPMRDGVKLFTSVYLPNDRTKQYPILMCRTPYSVGPYGADRYRGSLGPSSDFARDLFIFVYQDVRGCYMSEGEFVNMRPHIDGKSGPREIDESTDTYDTIAWLLENLPNHNGRVGQWGISYPGFYASAGMIDSHPALKAVSPQAPIADWFWDDMHHNGAFILPLSFNFFSTFGRPRDGLTTESPDSFEHKTADGYQFFLDLGPLKNANELHFKGEIPFWNQLIQHPNYDAFWQDRNLLPHLKNIKAAVMVVGGWFDTEDLYGPLKTYEAIERQNPGIFNVLVMGPWVHGGWSGTAGDRLGTADFGFKTSEYYQQHIDLPFFKKFLKDEGELDLPEALMFETGANRWRRFDQWPPKHTEQRSLYMAADGQLVPAAPTELVDAGVDEFISDPSKPVPYTMEITTRWAKEYMTEDQRFAGWRPDVLVYQTPPLEEDLTLAGPVEATLWTSTTGTDADWIVKLIDVYPADPPGREQDELGATQRLVRAEVFRGRFRNSFEHPEPHEPNALTRIQFELLDALHTFKRGHRLMIQVQSTWFPFVDRNPQKYVANIFEAQPSDFIKATHRLHRTPTHPSQIKFPVLNEPQ